MEAPPLRDEPTLRRGLPVRRAGAVAAALVVLAAVVVAVQLVLPRSQATAARADPGARPSPSGAIATGSLRSVGVVPWRDAVRSTADSRTFTIGGDGDQVRSRETGCRETNAQRLDVHETATKIEILVRGYRNTEKPCTEVGHPVTVLTVHLKKPIGSRALVDLSDGSTHAVLTETDVATATTLPPGMVDDGASWDDRFSGVSRWYTLGTGATANTPRFMLELGPAGSLDALDHPYWNPGPSTTVHGHAATVWRHSDVYNVNTLIQWRIGRLDYRLESFGTPPDHLSEQEMISTAQSVQIQTRPLPAVTR